MVIDPAGCGAVRERQARTVHVSGDPPPWVTVIGDVPTSESATISIGTVSELPADGRLAGAVFVIVVAYGVPGFTLTTRVNWLPPTAKHDVVHVIAPVPPGGGVEQDHPAGGVRLTKVVFDGVDS